MKCNKCVAALFILISTELSSTLVRSQCSGNVDRCEWTPWNGWSDCSRACGGGTRYRDRYFCCKAGLEIRACMADCGWDYDAHHSGFDDSEKCNSVCNNGGYMSSGYCHCPDRYKGTCCSEVVTCGRPSSISHGSFSGSDFTYAGKVRYKCYTNYGMTNPSEAVRTCTKYGYWSGSSPTCLYAVSCNSSPCKNRARCKNLLGGYKCYCTSGWTGTNCELDIQPPVVSGCPTNRNLMISNMTTEQIWTEPNITDPHGTKVHITKNYETSVFEFPWGEYTIHYRGVKLSNGLSAECRFTISVKPFPCKKMSPPENGIILCNGWRSDYLQICVFECKEKYTLPPGSKESDIYVCGATGQWLPPKPVKECVDKELYPYSEAGKTSTCTSASDKQALADLYIERLETSPFNATCQQHPDDCINANVFVAC